MEPQPEYTRLSHAGESRRVSLSQDDDNTAERAALKRHTAGRLESSKSKLYAVVALFIISLLSFVSQTELTSYLYNSLDYDQPYLLLVLTHSSWLFIWPTQVISIAIYKHIKRSRKHGYSFFDPYYIKRNFHDSIRNQHRNVYKTSGTIINEHYTQDFEFPHSISEFIMGKSMIHIIKCVFALTLILNTAGVTWYIAMAMAPASDITAIYNCSAFTALLFAVPILHERFTYVKLSAVGLAIAGVFFVAYGGDDDGTSGNDDFPDRVAGDMIIAIGAIMYGLYEVLYKKLVCPPLNAVSSRRLVAFSNFCASLIGLSTLSLGWMLVILADLMGWSKFHWIPSAYTWLIIIISVVCNLVFSLSFLSLMSLTSPVLSSVSSLVTIFIVGLVEWVLFGVNISFGQVIGDLFVIVGFGVLSYSYWAEITEEDVDDESDIDPTDTEA